MMLLWSVMTTARSLLTSWCCQLAVTSEYFKTIFRNNGHQNPLICLEGVSSPELRNILDYMYIGEANIYQENLDNFLSLAQRLKLLGLLQSPG